MPPDVHGEVHMLAGLERAGHASCLSCLERAHLQVALSLASMHASEGMGAAKHEHLLENSQAAWDVTTRPM